MCKNILTLLVTLGLFLGLSEGAARLLFPQWRGIWPQSFMMTGETLGVYTGLPGFKGRLSNVFGEYDVGVHLDSLGYRNGNGNALATANIIAAGDSFGFGWGVADGEIFSRVAGEAFGGQVYNLSVPGADLSDVLLILRHYRNEIIGKTLVVSVTVENDVLPYPTPGKIGTGREIRTSSVWARAVLGHSALAAVSANVLQRSAIAVGVARKMGLFAATPDAPADPDQALSATLAVLGAMREEGGFERMIVVIVPPRPGFGIEDKYQRLVSALRVRGFPVVDPGIEADDFFPKDGHWTVAAHARAGRLLARMLIAR